MFFARAITRAADAVQYRPAEWRTFQFLDLAQYWAPVSAPRAVGRCDRGVRLATPFRRGAIAQTPSGSSSL